MRRLLIVLAVVFLGVSSFAQAAAAAASQRNVVLIIADDLGLDLGCYGNDWIKTPNLDALAGRGVRFTHAFTTVASCSPSRAAVLTGQYVHTNGQYGLAHAEHHQSTFDRVRSVPAILNDAGYRTGVVGKLHVTPPAGYPFTADLQKVHSRNPKHMADRIGAFLAGEAGGPGNGKEKPFFLLVGFSDPHRAGSDFTSVNEQQRRQPGAGPAYDPARVKVPAHLPDQPEVRAELAGYAECVARLDRGVGLVMKAIEDAGRADDTLILFISDNGIPFPGAKTNLYEPGVRLPLIVASPDLKRRGGTCDAMTSWVDLAPTILDWAGVKAGGAGAPASEMPGRSLLPILEQEKPLGWDVVYGSHVFHQVTMYYPMRMIRTRRHKLILNLAHGLPFPFASDLHASATWQGVLKRNDPLFGRRATTAYVNRPRWELYDLEKDPGELTNLADDPASKPVLDGLQGRLRQWQEQTRDPWVVKYEHE